MTVPRFGLNRFDSRSVDAFAADVRRAEALGWDAALQPDSQLRRRDTYVLLAAAARATERIMLGPLLANPVNRHPTVTASSIATIDELAPGRTLLGWGVGDTAVRLAGLRPARVKELEASTLLMRALLDGEGVDVGAARPAHLPHHRPVPIWIAAGGPADLAHGRRLRRRRLPARGDSPGEHHRGRRWNPGGRRRGGARPGGGSRGAHLPHRARGRPCPRVAHGQVHGRRLLRVLADLVRGAAARLVRAASRDAQARAPGVARLPPRVRSGIERSRRGLLAGGRGATRSACAEARRRSPGN